MDVSPRPVEALPPRARRRRPWVVVVLALIVVAAGVVVAQGLNNATLYFYNADEAVAKRDDLGERRFRIQGEVQQDVDQDGEDVAFEISFNGVTVPVQHVGDPPDLFQPGLPVVLEGRWQGEVFASDRILVKHSNEYKAENPDRVDPAAP